ncbi:hypothetical protein [Sunxiuqinia rutila]|uniref:hypothetical protein n=1 Tax=Sunxiuqinia rutila TaxID=1397841 RepID=UPI003D359E56
MKRGTYHLCWSRNQWKDCCYGRNELPCTHGFPEERALSLIAGGIADASIEIEPDFEKDA